MGAEQFEHQPSPSVALDGLTSKRPRGCLAWCLSSPEVSAPLVRTVCALRELVWSESLVSSRLAVSLGVWESPLLSAHAYRT